MATSPIYNWPEPDNTDLVKNGALAIRTLGNAIDTTMATMTPKSTFTAKGSIAAATAASTPANVSVGTNKKVLTADSTAAAGVEWAYGGMTLISRTSFSNVASQIFDNVFDASLYRSYKIIVESIISTGTGADDLQIQLRYGSTTQTTGYYGVTYGYPYNSSTLNIIGHNGASAYSLAADSGAGAYPTTASIDLSLTNSGSALASWVGGSYAPLTAVGQSIQGGCSSFQTYTGFLLKSSSTNISGTVAIYGLAI